MNIMLMGNTSKTAGCCCAVAREIGGVKAYSAASLTRDVQKKPRAGEPIVLGMRWNGPKADFLSGLVRTNLGFLFTARMVFPEGIKSKNSGSKKVNDLPGTQVDLWGPCLSICQKGKPKW